MLYRKIISKNDLVRSPNAPTKPRPSIAPKQPQPAKEPKPGRPSPFPGKKPRPIVDPKNFGANLVKNYFSELPLKIKQIVYQARPFESETQIKTLEKIILDEKLKIDRRISELNIHRSEMPFFPSRIRQLQKGYEKLIESVINRYLEEIFGSQYHGVCENLEISLENKILETEQNSISLSKENTDSIILFEDNLSAQQTEELIDTLLSTEFFNFLVQGFGILYMDGFFQMMRSELSGAHQALPNLYEKLHLLGQSFHYRFFIDLLENKVPKEILYEIQQQGSLGKVLHRTEPVMDPETQNILEIRSEAEAYSEIGVVLAHEALKGIFQLLTPWAKYRENFLENNQLAILRLVLNSVSAEIRQFAIGPAFFKMFQNFLDQLKISTHLNQPDFYIAIQNAAMLSRLKLKELLNIILTEKKLTEIEETSWRNILVAPLNKRLDQI